MELAYDRGVHSRIICILCVDVWGQTLLCGQELCLEQVRRCSHILQDKSDGHNMASEHQTVELSAVVTAFLVVSDSVQSADQTHEVPVAVVQLQRERRQTLAVVYRSCLCRYTGHCRTARHYLLVYLFLYE